MSDIRMIQIADNLLHACQPNSCSLPHNEIDLMLIYLDDKNKHLEKQLEEVLNSTKELIAAAKEANKDLTEALVIIKDLSTELSEYVTISDAVINMMERNK